jgi:hypothetical protein
MQGVTTALVSFLFVCIIFPNLIKSRAQYYAAFAAVCLIIFLDAIGIAISPTTIAGFRVFAYAAVAFLQIVAMLLLFLAAGGITWRELSDDMKDAYEVIRRGGEEKEIIVPLSGELARRKEQRAEQERIVINAPPASTTHESIPVEEPDSPAKPS